MNYITIGLIVIDLIIITVHIFSLQSQIKRLNDKISKKNKEDNKVNNSFKRKHSIINPVSFNSPIQARKKLYKDFENEKGLYEPVTPKKGIVIKEDK